MAVSKPRTSPMLPVLTPTRPRPAAMPRTRRRPPASSRSLLLLVVVLQSLTIGVVTGGWLHALHLLDVVLDAQPQRVAPSAPPRPWS